MLETKRARWLIFLCPSASWISQESRGEIVTVAQSERVQLPSSILDDDDTCFFFAFSIASSFYGTQHAVRVINRDTGSTSWLSCVCLSVFVMRRVHFRIKWQNGSFHLCRLMFIRNYCTSSDVCLFCVFVYLHGGRIAQCTTMACEFYSTFCFYILEIVIIIMRCDTKIRIQLTNKWFFSYIQQLGRSSFGRMDR